MNDKTLHLPRGRQQPSNRPMSSTRSGGAWQHHADLAAHRGRMIRFSFVHSPLEFEHGKLIDSDQFTLKIELEMTPGETHVVTLFKHVLGGFILA